MGEEVIWYVEKQLTPIFNRMDKLAKQQKENTKATKRAAEEVSTIKTREEENNGNSIVIKTS